MKVDLRAFARFAKWWEMVQSWGDEGKGIDDNDPVLVFTGQAGEQHTVTAGDIRDMLDAVSEIQAHQGSPRRPLALLMDLQWSACHYLHTQVFNLLARLRARYRAGNQATDHYDFIDVRSPASPTPFASGTYVVECYADEQQFMGSVMPAKTWQTLMKIVVAPNGKIVYSKGQAGETWKDVTRYSPHILPG